MTLQLGFSKAREILITVLCLSCTSLQALQEPRVLSYSPKSEHIPSNTLRMYVQFSESMGLRQVREHIVLLNDQGEVVVNPFLNLGRELWDSEQKVLTLLFDPGRIKRGVGPNLQSGAPLLVGNTYHIQIKAGMESAAGVSMSEEKLIKYQIEPPLRTSLNLHEWQIKSPTTSTAALTIYFDRLMDTQAALRMIAIVSEDGKLVKGRSSTNGLSWNFMPKRPWVPQSYKVVVSPDLEDISGNTRRAPFDAPEDFKRKPVSEGYLNFVFAE